MQTLSDVAPVESIRSHFPALGRIHHGRPVAYFDGPGGTQVPQAVVDAVSTYLLNHNANTHWAYPSSAETDALLTDARAALADFLGAAPQEIAFGANMTTLTFHLARALGQAWGPQDAIVVTQLDHQANVAPWTALAAERGVQIRTVPFHRATGTLDWDAFEKAVGPATRLVAIGAASNALGTINDIPRAVALARSVGALVFVDAVHFAAHELVDVAAWGCDFLACSAYKFYGPHVGVLYGRAERLAALDVPKLDPAPDTVPERIETGTLNHEGIVGAAAAVDFLAGLGTGTTRRARLQAALGALYERGGELLARLWNGLADLPGVRLYGPPPGEPRTPTLAFTVDGHTSQEVAAHLAERGVFVSHGDFYASGVTAHLGLAEQGLVRAGCACYTMAEEIDRLVDGVRRLG